MAIVNFSVDRLLLWEQLLLPSREPGPIQVKPIVNTVAEAASCLLVTPDDAQVLRRSAVQGTLAQTIM